MKHKVKKCKEVLRQPPKGYRRSIHAYPLHQQKKSNGIDIDHNGFQQVRNNEIRKIYILDDKELRKDAFGKRQAIEIIQVMHMILEA